MKDRPVTSLQTRADLLGPVFLYWLYKLHQNIRYLDDGDTKFLFCARAGVRISALYDVFRAQNGYSAPPSDMFWISRMAVCKGVFARTPHLSCKLLEREFAGQSLAVLLQCLLRDVPGAWDDIAAKHDGLEAFPSERFSEWIDGDGKAAQRVRAYLTQTSEEFETYLASVRGKARRLVLIDSGWKGTSQALLAQAFPEHEWLGLYFGLIPEGQLDGSVSQKAVGCVFEADEFDPARPETAFSQYRHLIEATLETNAPSIERAPASQNVRFENPIVSKNLNEVPDKDRDAGYLELLNCIRATAHQNLTEVHVGFQSATQSLAQAIIFPTRSDAEMLAVKSRSADLGREMRVPVLISPNATEGRDRFQRLNDTLWYPGQLALEYDAPVARHMQEQWAKSGSSHDTYFVSKQDGRDAIADAPIVAIVTRTKDRPILLARAARSVAEQTYPNYIWIVVNDGGAPSSVETVLQDSIADMRRTVVVHHAESQGMEAASNAGIAAVPADYVLLHDDDDTIAPTFLEETVAFLQSAAGQKYAGVITQSVLVEEAFVGETLIEEHRENYFDWVDEVQLPEMATGNFFPPIAFLYRRDMWEQIGGYDETLPVLGDWYFNLEFLSRKDIGIIPKQLAFYHQRMEGTHSATHSYSNSVVGGKSMHKEFDAIIRNKIIRNRDANPVLAALMSEAYLHKATRASHHKTVSMALDPNTGPSGASDPHTVSATPDPDKSARPDLDTAWVISNCRGGTLRSHGLVAIARFFRPILPTPLAERLGQAILHAGGKVAPEPSFDERAYLDENQDVFESVASGNCGSGYLHFVTHGAFEGRKRPTR